MKRSETLMVALLSLAAGGLACWFLLPWNRGTESHGGSDQPTQAADQARPGEKTLTFEPFPEFGRMDYGSKEFDEVCYDRLLKWLEVRGRDAASLMAVRDIVGKKAIMQEAAEKFPNDPRVCMDMITREEDRDLWIERLISAEPDNPAGFLLKADALAKSGKAEEAIEAMRKAAALSGRLNWHLRERVSAVREAALAIGVPAWETAMLCLKTRLISGGPILSKPYGLLRKGLKAAKDSDNRPRMIRLAELWATLGDQLFQSDMSSIGDQLIGNFAQIAGLSELDAGSKWKGTNQTVGQRLAEVKQQKLDLSEHMATVKGRTVDILKASGPQLLEYEDRILRDGEMAAEIWYREIIAAQPKAAE